MGYVARPLGAAIFGHFGDRIGRKKTLVTTLLMTGFATLAVGLVPTYASIGIWGAVLLTILRLIQGVGVGGECGGSVLAALIAECFPPGYVIAAARSATNWVPSSREAQRR